MKSKSKYYNSIDTCSILLFNQIIAGKKNILDLCYKGVAEEEAAEDAFNKINAEIIEEFGVSPEYRIYLGEKSKLCQLINDYYNKNETWKDILIKVKVSEISNIEKSGGNASFTEILGVVSKKMGFPIDPSKTSIRQFYSYIKTLKDG